jgi:hypothetical protein
MSSQAHELTIVAIATIWPRRLTNRASSAPPLADFAHVRVVALCKTERMPAVAITARIRDDLQRGLC